MKDSKGSTHNYKRKKQTIDSVSKPPAIGNGQSFSL